MKRELRKMFAILAAMFFLPFVLLAQNTQPEYGVVIDEGFENGIPATWTQEKVSGSIDWIVEKTNLTYPNGTAEGEARLAFRNTTGTTTKATTRLVLPAVDVAAYYQPIVVYSFAQEKWSGDCDRLRVLCRTSENGDWILLKQHDSYVSKWTVDTLFLPTENYCQIAFEAVDNLGRGVVLDKVIVRSTPSCFKPFDFLITNVSNDSAVVNWRGSYDAEYFDVRVSEVELTDKDLESASTTYILNTTTEAIDIVVKNLEPGKKYYCYVKSHCENEVSGWASTTFETANIMALPYKENFNLPYTSAKVVSYLKGWYYFGSEELKPYINTTLSNGHSGLSYTTSDKTYSLVFSGGFTSGDAYGGQIPAGSFVYAATPQAPCAVNRLRLSFESIAFLIGAAERSSIVVGVMDDPLDRSTFVSVDTVNITTPLMYEEFSVSFEKYEGNGKYIAFMSDFPETNRFTLDNLLIEERTDTLQKVNFELRVPTATSLQLDFVQKYESYEVIVANTSVNLNDTTKKLAEANIIAQKTVTNLEEITSESMTPGATYYVYARAKKGDKPALWTRARRVVMPTKLTEAEYPYLMTFENARTKVAAYNDFSAGSSLPAEFKAVYDYPDSENYVMQDSAEWANKYNVWPKARTKTEFLMRAHIGDSANVIAVFPEMDLTKTKVGFYATRRKDDVRTYSIFYVGIMSDANDQNSFVAIDTITPADDYAYYEFDLSAYTSKIPGKFFAIKIDKGGIPYKTSMDGYDFCNQAFIDDITISKVSDCKSPIDIEVELDPENPEVASIVWNPNTGKVWNVRVATTNYDKNKFDDPKLSAGYEFVYDQQVTSPKAELTGLEYPKVRYYYWVQAVCGETTTDWSEAFYFETQCRPSYPVPYEQNFDKFQAGSQVYEWPAYCLFATRWTYSSTGTYSDPSKISYYPYIANRKSYNGENSYLLFKGKTSGSPTYRMYVAFPEMKAAVDSLQISFKMISGNTTSGNWASQGISVGVMTDPTKYSTFEAVEEFTPTGTWKQYTTKFNAYEGEGLHIAILADDRYTISDSVYIDDVVIDYITPCNDITNVKLFDVTSTTANIKWTSDADSFIFVLSTEPYDILGLEMLDIDSMRTQPNVVLIDTLTAATKFVEDLAINGKYYVYIKGICSGRYTEWSKELMFKTYCTSTPIEKFKADFQGDTNGQKPDCWVCGSTGGTTSMDYSGSVKNNALFLRTTTSGVGNGAYAVSPYLECDDISNYKVRFKAHTSTSFMYPTHTGPSRAYQKAVIVGVATDPYALETMVPIDTIYDILPEKAVTYEVYLDSYEHDLNEEKGHHVFFWSYFPMQNAVYIDDIEFIRISECPRFESSVVSKTSNSVKFEIESIPASYEIKYATAVADTAKLNGNTLPSIQCTSGEVEITGLNPHTRYFFYARSTADTCNEWSMPFVAETNDLDSVDLPYTDGFEAQKYASYGQVPYNWTGLYMDNDLSYPYVSTTQKKAGSRSVEMYPKLGAPIYLVSPKLNVEDIANVRFSFSVYNSQAYDRAVTVGVVSDINNIVNTFVPIDTIIFNKDLGWVTAEYIVGDYYQGSAKYIAFKGDDELNASLHSNNKNGAQFFIDDVSIEELPSCRYPENVLLKSITTNSVTVSFTNPGKATSYEVKCVSEGADPDVEAGKSQIATVLEITVADLASNATYDVYIRSLCPNDDKSPWIFVGTYTTLPNAVSTFPYECNFEDAEDAENWGFVHSSGKTRWFIGVDKDSVVADKVNSTDAALYVSGHATGQSAKKATSASNAWAYRYVYLKEGTYTISYDWVCPGVLNIKDNSLTAGATYNDYMRIALVSATASITSPTAMIDADGSAMDFTKNYVSNYPVPASWIEFSPSAKYGLYDYYGYAGTNTSLALDKQWQRETKHVDITKDKEGYYMLVFYWANASGTESKVRSGAIDNVSIHSYTCNSPYNVKVNDYLHNEADLSWSTFAGSTQYEVRILSEDVDPDEATAEQIVFNKTVTSKSVKATGLVPFTTHYVYVRALCSADNASEWSNPAVFKTLLAPFPEGHVYSFEEVEEIYYPKFVDVATTNTASQNSATITKTSASLFHNWYTRTQLTKETIFSFTKTNSAYYPQIVKNGVRTSTSVEARTGEYALFFRSYTSTTNLYGSGATVAMPYMGELDDTRLVFYMRCFSGTASKGVETQPAFYLAKGTTSSSYNYLDLRSNRITVGTMTDPNDPTTFVPLDTVQYPYNNQDYYINQSFKTKDPSNDHGWYRVVLPLDNVQGRFVAFRQEHYGTANKDIYNAVWIDDISLIPVGACAEPYELKAENLAARSADINFDYEGKVQFIIEVSTTEEFTEVLMKDTVESLPIKLTGLEPETRYYARVKAKCNAIDESDWAPAVTFVTPAEICFNVSFDFDSAGVKGWEFSQQPDPERLFSGASSFQKYTPRESTTYGWLNQYPIFASGMFSTRHVSIASSSVGAMMTDYWLLSPIVALEPNTEQHLIFDLAMTTKGANTPAGELVKVDPNSRFMVVISEDAGHTWKAENATTWSLTVGDNDLEHSYAAIPFEGKQYSIDLSKYKGKNIKIGFYHATRSGVELHMDNVHINRKVGEGYSASLCEFEDFEDENFFITSDKMKVGENVFHKWLLAEEKAENDTLLTLNINVTGLASTEINKSICLGDVYNENGFTGLMESGVYKRKFPSAVGCDSVVTLNLNVIEPVKSIFADTICFGGKYVWNGKEYNKTGAYVDTLVAASGCDSIVTFVLTVLDKVKTEEYVNICYGETYQFGSQVISTTGKFEQLFKTADGCDSLVTLYATVLPNYVDTINAVIKDGEEYTANGFKGLKKSGTFTLPLKSVDGCDSTLTLNLTVLSNVTSEESITLCFGDTYTFGTQEISKEGQYTQVFKAADGGDSTVLLTVTVLPDYRQTINATICAGEVYNENGFNNLTTTGVYKNELKSVDDCDSTITLNLTVLSGDTTRVEFTITTDDLPYEYQDLYFDKTTDPGTYVDTIVVETENCEEIIIHTLIVEQGVAVDNVNSYDLIMVPNPVTVNGTLYINAEFTPEERDGLVVEVFNAIGQRVYVEYPSIYPIEITGLAERGMYVVRIIAGDGKAYTGKIIVE